MTPSEGELKAAQELFPSANYELTNVPIRETTRIVANLIATHTRCDGLTAEQWKAMAQGELDHVSFWNEKFDTLKAKHEKALKALKALRDDHAHHHEDCDLVRDADAVLEDKP